MAATRPALMTPFDGTHPTFRQSPPIRSRSISATLAPSPAAPDAVTRPAVPAPMTTRLYRPAGVGFTQSAGCTWPTSSRLASSAGLVCGRRSMTGTSRPEVFSSRITPFSSLFASSASRQTVRRNHWNTGLLAGDETAFEALVAALHLPMLRFVRTFISRADVAEEVVRETWLTVVRGLEGFEGRSDLHLPMFARRSGDGPGL